MVIDEKTTRQICKAEGIAVSTMFKWLSIHEEFAERYARARDMLTELDVEDIKAIADDNRHDVVMRVGKDGEEYPAVNHDAINRARLMVDARKWIAAKRMPKKYGDRVEQHHTGDGSAFTGLTIIAPKEADHED